MVPVAIVGHRDLGGARTSAFVADASESVLSAARSRWPTVTAISALAEGADTIFAETALALEIPLRVVRPFRDYEEDFVDEASRRCKTRFEASDLRNVNFTNATLSGTTFIGSKVAGAILTDARLDRVEGEVDLAADDGEELVLVSTWLGRAA